MSSGSSAALTRAFGHGIGRKRGPRRTAIFAGTHVHRCRCGRGSSGAPRGGGTGSRGGSGWRNSVKVLAALSGGVDSAVAAARAVEAGHDVAGVHMALSRNRDHMRAGSRGCCTIEDASDARRASAILNIPYYVWVLSAKFAETVVSDFSSEYEAGRTPKPCVRCNEHIKFQALLDKGVALGFAAVSTGHYARIVEGFDGQELHRSVDAQKDQSYVLAVMGPERLAKAIFPLGDVATKDDVRAEAEARGLGIY